MATKPKHTIKKGKDINPPSEWRWVQVKKDAWVLDHIPSGEVAAPRFTESTADSKGVRVYFCYRNSIYLGSEKSVEDAQDRCWIGERSRASEAFIAFQEEHPGKIPPGMPFTEAQYHEWKRHNPGGPGTAHLAVKDAPTKTLGMKKAGNKILGDVQPGQVIRILKPDTKKREPGTHAHNRWTAVYECDGKTVAHYLALKHSHPHTLMSAVRSKHVRIE